MATRPIVPRANGEGSLGVASKYWGNTFTQKLNGANAVDMADFSTATLRQPSTAQSVGDIRYHATLPAGWYLECTTAGTTGSGELTITSPTVGGTVSDGTVTWKVRKNASTQDLTDYLLLSGGKITGNITHSNSGWFNIVGGESSSNSASIQLASASIGGRFNLIANDGNQTAELLGYKDGTLTWAGNSLDKSAVVAESLGTNGYRKYASGLIEQWGSEYAVNGSSNITYPISFTKSNNTTIVQRSNAEGDFTQYSVTSRTSSDFKVTANNTEDRVITWFAIGY